MEGNIIQLKEYHLNKGASKDHTPVFPMTKASAIEGMSELLKDLKINGVTPTSDISEVNSPEKGKIYYEESTDKYYVYNEAQSNFVELGAGTSIDPSDVMPTITQEASTQSGGDNIITFTFPNGDTTEIVIKNGTQGNSGYTGAAGELEVVNNLEDGGATAALSAEMGKDLANKAIPTKGTFSEAYAKARINNVTFPWFLSDVDENGNAVNKIIWHIGDKRFVDGIGAEIDGVRDGVTIRATGSGKVKYRGRDSSSAPYGELSFTKGVNNYSFAEIAAAVKEADSSVSETYDGSTFSDVMFEFNDASTTVSIDFGNQKCIGNHVSGVGNGYLLHNLNDNTINRITSIKRSVVEGFSLEGYHNCGYGNQDNTLEYVQLSGNTTNTSFSILKYNNNIKYLDLSGFDITGVTKINSMLSSDTSTLPPVTLDIRTWDTSNVTDISGFMLRRKNATIIIGNFSTKSASTTTNSFNFTSGVTVVCTSDTPPDLSFDWITTHVSSIKIPNKTVTVDGNDVTVLSLYQNHVQNDGDEVGESGWSKYASIMTTYEEGEY